ncbi:unnamed protein product [Trichobilharzia szidati]|nr:unnamed protein product [Trichobilharzia szidati]
MNKAKKSFIFIPSELTEYHIWRNVLKSNSTVYLLGYTLPCNVHNSTNENNNNNEVVLILGFYNSPPTENNQICPYCYTRIYSEDCLHICARSLRKYKFESSYIKKYNPLSDDYNNNNASNIWISVDMNTLPSSLKHGIMMKYTSGFNYPGNKSSSEGDSFNRWMCSIMQNEIGQPLNHLIRWLNESSGDTNDSDWDWPSSIQHQHKIVNSQPESGHFIPTTMIQCCTKIINKCVNFSYTLSLIKYHFDTAKPRPPPPPPPQSSSIASSMKKCSTSLLKNNNDNNIQQKEKDNVRVNSSTRSIHPSVVSCLIPDASLSMIGAIQLLILILCLITVPYKSTNNHNHSSHYYSYDDNGDMGNGRKCCIQESLPPPPPPTRQSPSPPPPRRCCRDYTTSGLSILPSFPHTTTNKDDSSSSGPMNWLPNDLNCKIIPTLGLFYLDNEEDNYTSKLSSASSSSSSSSLAVSSSSWFSTVLSTYLPALILYNSTNDITRYISSSSAKFEDRCCWMNILYRCVEYFTCELTRLLLWLESGKPAGLKMNLHLAHLMGQFFLYHILAWRSYVTFIIYILFIHVLSILQQFTEVDTFNVYFLANLTTIICLIFSTVYLLATTPTSVSDGDGQSVIRFPLIIKVFVVYFSIILRLMLALLTCLLLDIIELITLHLTSFYIYATHLLRLQLRTISASWRLCRNSSKWNPLRHRVDKIPDMYIDPNEVLLSISSLQKKISLSSSSSLASSSSYSAPPSSPSSLSSWRRLWTGDNGRSRKEVICGRRRSGAGDKEVTGGEEDTLYKFVTNKQNSDMLFDQLTRQKCGVYLDRLLVSTLLGLGIGLCLFSTTIAFYITFTCIQLCLLLVKNILKCTVWFIMDFPLESIVLWTCNSPYYKTKLIIEAPKMNSKHFKCLRLKLTRIDFHEMYAESHLVRKALFSKGLSFRELLHRVICAEDIR